VEVEVEVIWSINWQPANSWASKEFKTPSNKTNMSLCTYNLMAKIIWIEVVIRDAS
jgi:hypothetical protein